MLGEAFVRVRPDTKHFRRDAERGLSRPLGIVGRKAGLAMGGAFAAVGVGSLIKSSVQVEKTFSQTMHTMAEVASVPQSEIAQLSKLAMKMGADTVFSANDAAQAMLELAKGGLSAATIQGGALQGTLTLAAAGGLELGAAATIASNAMTMFNLKGSDMSSVAAALAGGANASSASVESLAQALSQVGGIASSAGLSLQEAVAVLSAMDAEGYKGSDAGTSLKTMLSRLVPQTEKAANAMKSLGLDFTDARGDFIAIDEIAGQLQKALGGLSESEQSLALDTMFGSDAKRAALTLMENGAKGIRDYTKATSDQAAAQRVADARMKGTAGALEAMSGSIETAQLAFGRLVAPLVVVGAKRMAQAFNVLGETVPNVGSALAAGFSGDLASAKGPLRLVALAGDAFGALTTGVDASGSSVSKFAVALRANGAKAVRAVGGALTAAVPVVTKFAGEMGGRLAPLLPKVADLVERGAAAFNAALPAIATVAGTVGGVLVDGVSALLTVGGPLLGMLQSLGGFFSEHDGLTKALTVTVLAAVAAYKGYKLATSAQAKALELAGSVSKNYAKVMTSERRAVVASMAAKAKDRIVMIASAAAQKAAAIASKAFAAAQWLVNAALTMNPIGLVIAALVALGVGLVIAYKKSETFRKVVDGAFKGVLRIGGDMAAHLIRGFRMLLTVWLETAGGILHGAALAFGWIKGVGGKLKTADKAFREFKDGALATLDDLAEKADALGEKTGRNLKAGFTRIVGSGLNTVVSVTPSGRIFEHATVPGRALGGSVHAGMPYVVGERRPELFVPDSDGTILPTVPTGGGVAGMSRRDMRRLARYTAEEHARRAAPAVGRAAQAGAMRGLGAAAVNAGRA